MILGQREQGTQQIKVTKGQEQVSIRESKGEWRWPDDAAIPGSTARRLAGLVTDLKALGFHDKGVKNAGLNTPAVQIEFTIGEDDITVSLGRKWETKPDDSRARPDRRQFLKVSGDDTIYEVDVSLNEVADDILREYGRKLTKDAEKTYQTELDENEN